VRRELLMSPERFDVYRRFMAELANEVHAMDELDEFIDACDALPFETIHDVQRLACAVRDFQARVRRIAGVTP
jgi:hypothetical protein